MIMVVVMGGKSHHNDCDNGDNMIVVAWLLTSINDYDSCSNSVMTVVA